MDYDRALKLAVAKWGKWAVADSITYHIGNQPYRPDPKSDVVWYPYMIGYELILNGHGRKIIVGVGCSWHAAVVDAGLIADNNLKIDHIDPQQAVDQFAKMKKKYQKIYVPGLTTTYGQMYHSLLKKFAIDHPGKETIFYKLNQPGKKLLINKNSEALPLHLDLVARSRKHK